MATDAPPVPQHLSALERANRVRLGRARIKRDVASGRTTIRDVLKVHELAGVGTLEDVDPAVASMTVGELLCCQYRWGVARMRKLLADVRVAESIPLEALTDRRRRVIVAAVEGAAHATRVEADRIARARAERAAREREAAARAARLPVGPLDVECPHCRSGVGVPCSWYDPVQDRWTEPKTPCAERLERAGRLS